MDDAALTEEILGFVRGLGIAVRERDLPESFLPGLDIGEGGIFLDRARLAHPGDLLHEAGHVAVAPPEQRAADKFSPEPADEMAAIAWSFAAVKAMNLPSEVVFHPAGYKGGAESIRAAFENGQYFGVPLLAWYRLCIYARHAKPAGPAPYPHMLRWVR